MNSGINVVAILGGLGSQMFKYAFFVDLKRKSPKKTYIDLSPFEYSKMWNGYELSRIFGIEELNVFPYEDNKIDFFKGYAINTLNSLSLLNKTVYFNRGLSYRYYYEHDLLSRIYNKVNRKIWQFKFNKREFDSYPENYFDTEGNVYFDEFDHKSDLYFADSKDTILKIFQFPPLKGDKNVNIAEKMLLENTVALHVRRTDHLYDNGNLQNNSFYFKSVEAIKKNCDSPSFFVFSDDIVWCKKNINKIGLGNRDIIYFIDWNKLENSYIDMQLMTFCHHNIVPFSSFSWWGAYLSSRKKKMSFAPNGTWMNIEFHF